jgi:succinate dehydrogenase/fumarate reductase iron-sulfur protein
VRKVINVKIWRYNPVKDSKPFFQDYKVPLLSEKGTTALMILNYIYENIDGSLAYYYSCKTGKCGGCMIRINGEPRLACTTVVNGDITLEPIPGFEVIRDLVVDFGKAIKKTEGIKVER